MFPESDPISIINLVNVYLCSSPRWLVSRGRLEEAKKSMIYFRGELAKHVECELRDCEHQVNSVYFFWTCKNKINLICYF